MAVEYLYGNTYDPPTDEENDDAQSRHTGHTVTFAADGLVKEWGLWVPATSVPANLKWRLWDDDTDELLAQVDVAALSPTPGTWARGTSADFDTPGDVPVLATGTYALVKYSLGGHWVFSGSTGSFDNGGNITAVEGRYQGASDGSAPPSGTFSFKPFVDVGFEADGGATEYTKSVAGTITPAGTLSRSLSRGLAGATTPTSVVTKQTSRSLTGSTTPAGTLAKQTGRSLAGVAVPAGSVAKEISRALAGSTTPAGSIARTVGKALDGTITPVGAIVSRAITRTLSGTISPAGTVLKALSRLLGGTITPTGSVSSAPAAVDVATSWQVGPPHGRWHTGPPHSRWHAGPPGG